ncbi:winged helix-turn-helix transcriptional regulator [Thermomonospora cellulosilytica]|uniref:DNA-binding HxlR family transcriptional regulator n=1 Tax=Thermomonospora cellulosilytica TaxID=1411118 RepID=A0A7W3MZK0_9ACTN|nr:winged helix-turn-helix transcriptional regulator [Thermomonospora cellulosilytica]MBA9004797.1 DNA-binding HxlR family transcriptional regulator [Thermomonospora cellulosilytica]
MPTSRSYRDSCGIARALDVVGERWALLVVRELLLAPQRFSELRHALPRVSSNLLADRLRELEHNGVIRRGPASGEGPRVYELTEWGRKLEPILLALGDWGVDAPQPPPPTALSATSVLLFLQRAARPDPAAPPTTCRLELDGRVWTVRLESGRVQVRPGEPATAAVSLRTEPKTLSALLADPAELATACADGSVAVVGDLSVVDRLLHAVADPWPSGDQTTASQEAPFRGDRSPHPVDLQSGDGA